MKFRIQLALTFVITAFITSCAQKEPKINGISFVASSQKVIQENILPVLDLHANYASVMPFGFIRNINHPEVIYNTKRQWFGETEVGTMQYIEILHQNNLQVMLKPQIWISHGEYTGNLKMDTNEEWKTLEETYRKFILDFAKLAQEKKVAVFCIGTEMEEFINHRPDYWNQLIAEIRELYSGKLTYAANWDEYKRVPFWEKLDYIGIDAYFPISESHTPTIAESRLGWQQWKEEIQLLSERTNRKIVFTEFGYRSINFTGKEPWKSDRKMTDVNLEAQNNLTIALFKEFWEEEWFAGGYLWKWFVNHNEVGGVENNQFTPQNKPVEIIIRDYYKIN